MALRMMFKTEDGVEIFEENKQKWDQGANALVDTGEPGVVIQAQGYAKVWLPWDSVKDVCDALLALNRAWGERQLKAKRAESEQEG